eukprot:CAMPEP_0119521384 /NCGR_PEP_ID=MMETSP1344-20130328/37094_1 /TAXON_ID=236787 /ORGANISM="Florenciella parvula, Strain CCMP2471" /LENGTH=80 /DNA_ID=CAMNT_0007559347 /DNA_START=225 /DNA_END=467 /DNA_ORIENTATION=+
MLVRYKLGGVKTILQLILNLFCGFYSVPPQPPLSVDPLLTPPLSRRHRLTRHRRATNTTTAANTTTPIIFLVLITLRLSL